jgi:hypothetical protein
MKEYMGGGQWCLTSCGLHQFIIFGIFISFNVFYYEAFDVALHSHDKGKVSFEGGFSCDALFSYLIGNDF